MFFFQDNIGYFIQLSQTPFWQWIITPVAEHFQPITNALLYLEYKLFGLNFIYYLIISLILHIMNCLLIYKLAKYFTRSNFWSILALILFSVNLTYVEPLLWTLQGLLLSTLFLGLAVYSWHRFLNSNKTAVLLLSGLMLLCSALTYGLGVGMGIVLAALTFIYNRYFSVKNLKSIRNSGLLYLTLGIVSIIIGPVISRDLVRHVTPQITAPIWSLIKYLAFVVAGIARGVIGRFFLPGLEPSHLEIFPTAISFIPAVLITCLIIRFLRSYAKKSEKFRLLVIAVFISFPYCWAGVVRYQFGLKQSLAERYAYPSLFFLVLLLIIILQKFVNIKLLKNKLLLVSYAVILISLQSVFFIKNAYVFEEKPLKTKNYFTQIVKIVKTNKIILDLPLPTFINQPYSISGLSPLLIQSSEIKYIPIDDGFCSSDFRKSLEDPEIIHFYTEQAGDPAVSPVFNLEKLRNCLFREVKDI